MRCSLSPHLPPGSPPFTRYRDVNQAAMTISVSFSRLLRLLRLVLSSSSSLSNSWWNQQNCGERRISVNRISFGASKAPAGFLPLHLFNFLSHWFGPNCSCWQEGDLLPLSPFLGERRRDVCYFWKKKEISFEKNKTSMAWWYFMLYLIHFATAGNCDDSYRHRHKSRKGVGATTGIK